VKMRSLSLLWCGLACCLVTDAPAATLGYSTFLDSFLNPTGITLDADGNIYIVGNVLDPYSRQGSIFVAKLNPSATAYQYVTYFGTQYDQAGGIAVDSAGSAYVTGSASSPSFPVTGTGVLGHVPNGSSFLGFVAKLDPHGVIQYSVTLGAGASNLAVGIALTPGNDIVIGGASSADNFPSTPGAAYRAATGPYIVELDNAATKVKFSVVGIGGGALAIDPQGNIYVAGSTYDTNYPTTPGAYQTKFVQAIVDTGLFPAVGANQYVSKIDHSGSKLLYSTGLNGMDGSQTSNNGLAVDSQGNAYLTGATMSYNYPITETPGPDSRQGVFLTKLDPTGASVIFSVQQGGSGVEVDNAGNVYAGGQFNTPGTAITAPPVFVPPTPLAGAPVFPSQCAPNNATSHSETFVMNLDASTGIVKSSQLIEGSFLSNILLAPGRSGHVWATGQTPRPDVPFTSSALYPIVLSPIAPPGAYLTRVDFSGPSTSSGPQIGCILDSADGAHLGPVAPGQLISLFGINLGPAQGVSASGQTSNSLAGVTVMFDDKPAPLLYVSGSQINAAVPFSVSQNQSVSTLMKVSVNGAVSQTRLLPVTPTNPSFFVDTSAYPKGFAQNFAAFALNSDGTRNSPQNPAKPASAISLFLNGVGSGPALPDVGGFQAPAPQFLGIDVISGSQSAEVLKVVQTTPYVWRVDVRLPVDQPFASVGASLISLDETNLQDGIYIPAGPLAWSGAGAFGFRSDFVPIPSQIVVWVQP
jgi:uncharacterized protein (TIGR03437 family)